MNGLEKKVLQSVGTGGVGLFGIYEAYKVVKPVIYSSSESIGAILFGFPASVALAVVGSVFLGKAIKNGYEIYQGNKDYRPLTNFIDN